MSLLRRSTRLAAKNNSGRKDSVKDNAVLNVVNCSSDSASYSGNNVFVASGGSSDPPRDSSSNGYGSHYTKPDGSKLSVKDWRRVGRCYYCLKGGYNKDVIFLWIDGHWYHETCCIDE